MSAVIDLLVKLVRIPSPSGEETALRDAVLEWLKARGVPAFALERNVVVVLEGATGSESDRGLLFCSHYDTVPIGPGWTRDPLDGSIENGNVYGRGSNDAKAAIAAMMCVLAGVDRSKLRGRLMAALVCDEETGGRGAEIVAPTLPPYSAAVVGEPTGLDVCPGQRGLLRAFVHETGRSCHASRPHEGVNAIEAAARDVLAIQRITMPGEHPMLGKATLVTTVIAGGTKPNVLPGSATLTLDGRSTPDYDNDRMAKLIESVVEGRVEVKSKRFQPISTPVESEIVRVAAAASPTHRVRGFGGVSDLFHLRGAPGIVMGPGTSGASHAPDEWVAVSQVEAAVVAYGAIVSDYLGAPVKEIL